MSEVIFYYGTMESSKSLQLLAKAHTYENQGKVIMCFKPALDNRTEDITTRAGFSRKADVVLEKNDNDIVGHVMRFGFHDLDAVLIDECQFFTREQVLAFTDVADVIGVPVYAYGLLSDFTGNQFEGSKAWVEYSNAKIEIEQKCFYCGEDALLNVRLLGNMPIFDGQQVMTGDTKGDLEKPSYKPVCRKCFKKAKRGQILVPRRKGRRVVNVNE